MSDCKQITVKKTVWVRTEVSHLYDEYVLTYSSVEKVKRNLYLFRLTKIVKLNDKSFTGGGGDIIRYVPSIGERKLLRKHKITWNVKNYIWAGRVVRWFNVKHPGKDENYIQTPAELYPIYSNGIYGLRYPKFYDNKH